MANYSTVFNQLLQQILRLKFQRIVNLYQADKYVKSLKTWNQFIALLYAQISSKESLRDIVDGLKINSLKLYHLGVCSSVKRCTLSDANKNRNFNIYKDLFFLILNQCKNLSNKFKFTFKNKLYS